MASVELCKCLGCLAAETGDSKLSGVPAPGGETAMTAQAAAFARLAEAGIDVGLEDHVCPMGANPGRPVLP